MTDHLQALATTLHDMSAGRLAPHDLARRWRAAAQQHQPPLPERYREVLERVLTQLESGALFTEESCSFSQADQVAALQVWLDKARALG